MPPKIKCFIWKALYGRLPTLGYLKSFIYLSNSPCHCCNSHEDTVDLFFILSLSSWFIVRDTCQTLLSSFPFIFLFSFSYSYSCFIIFVYGSPSSSLCMVLFTLIWYILKARNLYLYQSQCLFLTSLLHNVVRVFINGFLHLHFTFIHQLLLYGHPNGFLHLFIGGL